MKKKLLIVLLAPVLLWAIWFFSVPVELNLSSNFRIHNMWSDGADITSQLSEAEMEEIRQVLLTASCSRGSYAIAPFVVDENTVEIAAFDETYRPPRIRFYFVGSEGKYAFQTLDRTYRISNGEAMLQSILDIISD